MRETTLDLVIGDDERNNMHKFSDQKLLEIPLEKAYALVLDIESYNEFLPHIDNIHIISTEEGFILADMNVKFASFHQTYRSEIRHFIEEGKAEIDVKAIKGIFSHLHNKWSLTRKEGGTMINFWIEFEFSSKLLNSVAGPAFDMVSKKMISAFEARALEKYGKK